MSVSTSTPTIDLRDHYAFERAVYRFQREFHDHVLRPLWAELIERAYIHGDLPLPPLQLGRTDGWMRGEVWYQGDLV